MSRQNISSSATAIVVTALLLFTPLFSARASVEKPKLKKFSAGIELSLTNGVLHLEICADNIVRVAFSTNRSFFNQRTPATEFRRDVKARWSLKISNGEAVINTRALQAAVDLESGNVQFRDTNGDVILAERERALTPANVQSNAVLNARQEWEPNDSEALYGLGQNQLDLLDIKGFDLDLWQHNTAIAVPFLVSSRGYGILWDNLSYSRFGDLRDYEPIPSGQLFDSHGVAGGLTATFFNGRFSKSLATRTDDAVDININGDEARPNYLIHSSLPPSGDVSARWEGEIQPAESGDYLFQTYSAGGIKLWLDGNLLVNHWRQGWLPGLDVARVRLQQGHRCKIKLEWIKDQNQSRVRLLWKTPGANPSTSLWSRVADGVDYYFVYGPRLDAVVKGYRELTGRAPLMPLWAYGFWQSRERYKTADESLAILDTFRQQSIPIDNIVQDWRYWKLDGWGSHQFDPDRFPNPADWLKTIHDKYHAHLMLSVWGKFYPGTENFEALRSRGFLYDKTLETGMKDWLGYPYAFYDALNPAAGKLFWSQINEQLFSKGVDAWWMDATEPDLDSHPTPESLADLMATAGSRTAARSQNVYPLMNSRAIYEGQRHAAPQKRVFILSRSAFAGQQHYAAASWSGDISSTWTALRKQIPAGLGFAISGMPYWTSDIGGFAVPNQWNRSSMTPADQEEWLELQTRWFEYGAFCPIFRSHGQPPAREPWNIATPGHPAYDSIVKFDRLRYRLLPYIYSAAADVTFADGALMRPLVMDFQSDANCWNIKGQFMFGSALMVSPVVQYQQRERVVYLPEHPGGWYDFWTGNAISGGDAIQAIAPLDTIPLCVEAGSIIPIGPDIQYTSEKPADPLTLYVYAGADASFTLYEDDGLSYNYEKSQCSRILMQWNDAKRMLTIGKRKGSFKGMLTRRTFDVVLVSDEKPTGFSFTPSPDRHLTYSGKKIEVQF